MPPRVVASVNVVALGTLTTNRSAPVNGAGSVVVELSATLSPTFRLWSADTVTVDVVPSTVNVPTVMSAMLDVGRLMRLDPRA